MKIVRVELQERSYDVIVGEGLFAELDRLIPSFPHATKTALITDRNVDSLYGDAVQKRLTARGEVTRLVVDPGESSKKPEVAAQLLEELARRVIRRNDLAVTLGGGVVVDLGGFVASVYQRGMPVVHLPTTLLAQVDAAVGGKTGVNLQAGKNLAGTFYQPAAVVADVSTLATLPAGELRGGLAEVAKYGFCFAPDLLDYLEASIDKVLACDPFVLEEIVARCVEIKGRLVSSDERDVGERILLNYGHTFAHALEASSDYKQWPHGDAVSVGMIFAAALAQEIGILDGSALDRHIELLGRAGLPVSASFDPDEIIRQWSIDKKHRGGQRWVLLKEIGEPVIETGVDDNAVRRALDRVRSR